jgi:hypothetical protein
MALTATVDLSVTPPTLTVTSDKRKVSVEVTSAGETATGTATYPVNVTDSSGRAWTLSTDDGATAVYHG